MKILVIFPREMWTTILAASRRNDVQALQRNPNVELLMTGQGWSDWDNSQSALENATRIMPDADCIYTYKLKGNLHLNIPPVIDAKGLGASFLVVQRLQEAWEPNKAWGPTKRVSDFILSEGVGLVILSHANDRPRLKKAEDAGVRVAVIPIGADPSVFSVAARPWEERDIDILLTGNIGLEHYPLRYKFAEIINAGNLPGKCHIHSHPGSWAESVEDADNKLREFANLLGRSKISLCCSSKHKYPLAKYVESAMAGCRVVGDMPDDPPDEYLQFVHPVNTSWFDRWSNSRLTNQIIKAFEDPEIKAKAEAGRQLVLENMTWDHWAEHFIQAVADAKGNVEKTV